MFGHKWQPAEGTFVGDVRVTRFGPGDSSPMVRHYLIDVRPSDGEPFRAEVHEPLMSSGAFNGPTVAGQVVHLECDPQRKKARFSHDRAQLEADNLEALQKQGERLEAEERRESAERSGRSDD